MIDITELYRLFGNGSEDHIMVHKDVALALISHFGQAEVRRVIDAQWGNFVPDPEALLIDDMWFRSKVTLISRALGVSQSELAKASGINQGDMSKFETGLKSFGPQRKEKIVDALRKLKKEKKEKEERERLTKT